MRAIRGRKGFNHAKQTTVFLQMHATVFLFPPLILVGCLLEGAIHYLGRCHSLLWNGQWYFSTSHFVLNLIFFIKLGGVVSDTLKVNTVEIASIFSEDECDDPFVCLEEDADKLEDNETVLDNH